MQCEGSHLFKNDNETGLYSTWESDILEKKVLATNGKMRVSAVTNKIVNCFTESSIYHNPITGNEIIVKNCIFFPIKYNEKNLFIYEVSNLTNQMTI